MVDRVFKDNFGFWTCTPTAMIRENPSNFGLGATSVYVGYHRRMALALTLSLEDPSIRHRTVTLNLITEQAAHPKNLATDYLKARKGINLHIRRQLTTA
eukprot:1075704-Pelagomonas_calceolata.AAC.2